VPARIVSIQLCPGHREPMQPVSSAELITGVGLKGDKHANQASHRQVLLADKEALDLVTVSPGTIKENVTVEGLNVMDLAVGSRLRLGSGPLLQITEVCEPCFRMDEIRSGLKGELAGRRGMLSRVIQGGAIKVGDIVTVEAAESIAS
jgi:MOSC domain-containing protein YiiM